MLCIKMRGNSNNVVPGTEQGGGGHWGPGGRFALARTHCPEVGKVQRGCIGTQSQASPGSS